MPLKEIIEQINLNRREGLVVNIIHRNLLKKGYDPEEIQDAFLLLKTGKTSVLEIMPKEASTSQTVPIPPPQDPPLPPQNSPPPFPPSDRFELLPPLPLPPLTSEIPIKQDFVYDIPASNKYFEEMEKKDNSLPFLSLYFYQKILLGRQKVSVFLILVAFSLIYSFKPISSLIQTFYPFINAFKENAKILIDKTYPNELEIKIQNGVLSTNVTEPYYITFSPEYFDSLFPDKKGGSPKSKIRLLAIDTKGRAEKFENYQSLALLTSTSLIYYDNDKITIQPLKNIKQLTINKQIVNSKYDEINSGSRIENFLKIMLFAAPILIFIFFIIGTFIGILFSGYLVYLMIRIKQLKFGFKYILAYTAAVSVIPTISFRLLSLVPWIGQYMQIDIFIKILTLSVAYLGIVKLKEITTHSR